MPQALAFADRIGEQEFEAERYRIKGSLLFAQILSFSWKHDQNQQIGTAEASFEQAIAIAQRQTAKGWELRAAVGRCRLWHQRGQPAAAQQLLAPLYDWFTEGFDTADLLEAKALLKPCSDGGKAA